MKMKLFLLSLGKIACKRENKSSLFFPPPQKKKQKNPGVEGSVAHLITRDFDEWGTFVCSWGACFISYCDLSL